MQWIEYEIEQAKQAEAYAMTLIKKFEAENF
jgi:hypothetical protein